MNELQMRIQVALVNEVIRERVSILPREKKENRKPTKEKIAIYGEWMDNAAVS